nr:MAG TPA: hypothetical protein [Caudoviricetes sp.]
MSAAAFEVLFEVRTFLMVQNPSDRTRRRGKGKPGVGPLPPLVHVYE